METRTYRQFIEDYYDEWLNGSYPYIKVTSELKYPSPKLLADKLVDYFVEMREQNNVPNYSNLNLYLGFKSRSGLDYYVKTKEEYDGIIEVTSMLMEEIILLNMPVIQRATMAFKNHFQKYYTEPTRVINSYEPYIAEIVDKNK